MHQARHLQGTRDWHHRRVIGRQGAADPEASLVQIRVWHILPQLPARDLGLSHLARVQRPPGLPLQHLWRDGVDHSPECCYRRAGLAVYGQDRCGCAFCRGFGCRCECFVHAGGGRYEDVELLTSWRWSGGSSQQGASDCSCLARRWNGAAQCLCCESFSNLCITPGADYISQVFNYLAGSLSRIFTTLQEVDDNLILYSFVVGFVLNAVLAFQMIYYWNAPSKKSKGKQRETPIVAAASPGTSTAMPRIKGSTTRRKA